MNGHLIWYLARSAGFMAYGFAWAAVVWGLLLTTRLAPRLDRTATYLVHRLLGMGGALFLGVHLIALYLDPWAHFSLADLLVPFVASYRPVWLALGVIAAYLLGAIVLTSALKARLRFAWWLGIHYLAYFTVALGLVHGLGSGSDTPRLWARALYAASGVVVAVLWVARVGWGRPVTGSPAPAPVKRLDPVALALGPLAARRADRHESATPRGPLSRF